MFSVDLCGALEKGRSSVVLGAAVEHLSKARCAAAAWGEGTGAGVSDTLPGRNAAGTALGELP